MKQGKISMEAKVGILVLVGIILLFYMSFRVSRLERLQGEVYNALFPSVSGLVINASVEVAGVPVGRVEKIGLEKGMAKVWMKIGQAQLHKDAEAAVKTHGVLGDKYIEVKPGSPDTPLLPPGEAITNVRSAPDMDQLIASLESAAHDIADLGKSLNQAIGGEQGRNAIKEVVSNIQVASAGLKEMVQENKGKVNDIVTNLDDVSTKVKTGQGSLGKLLTDDKLYNEAEKTLRKMQKAAEAVEEQAPITALSGIIGLFKY
jgi:phospholipid/cholesterol/gamma-HCH transport system substrate-binding protein